MSSQRVTSPHTAIFTYAMADKWDENLTNEERPRLTIHWDGEHPFTFARQLPRTVLTDDSSRRLLGQAQRPRLPDGAASGQRRAR